jgi:beta-mannosidase
MYTCDLNSNWKLRYEELYCGRSNYLTIAGKTDDWFDIETLPCDVHVPLIEKGIIEEPLVADNCFKCDWIEDKSWWFKKVFEAGSELLDSHNSELVAEGLDVKADLFLNGEYLGHHNSAMYPFRQDVRDILQKGENVLIIRVTSGLEYYSELDLSKIKDYVSCEYKRRQSTRGDNRRALVRKPQYVYGWDWSPRVASCGIMGDVRIEAYDEIGIRSVKFTTRGISENSADISIEAEIENLCNISTLDANVELDISFDGVSVSFVAKEVFLTSGLNYVTFDLTIDNPMLWWPNGMGKQNLYTVKMHTRTSNKNTTSHEFKAGIRTLRLNTDRIDSDNRMFAFVVNGVEIFCKGANWAPADSIYGRVTDNKFEQLVREANEANFNMLRMWGGGVYKRDFFYECCDRYGILIWQDFGFACAAYPDELDWFRDEVEKEVNYQTKRLRNHPCLALWCGNNENQAHLVVYKEKSYWDGDKKPASPAGIRLYNDIMPRIVKINCPEIPYWNSSPYGGITDLECNECGDRHHYDSSMNEDVNKRVIPEEYDKIACKFVSEFSCLGPTKKSSLFKYYGSENVEIGSSIWKHHTNTFEKGTLSPGIIKHYADLESLSIEEYLLYGGLFQGLMLGYAFESMRCAENNYGALMWSYNDAWGEIGWSIIDYYLARKISYYFVKRALEHTKLIMRADEKMINIICTNDTPKAMEFELEYGYVTFNGTKKDTATKTVTVDPFCKSVVVAQIPKNSHDILKGLYYAKTDDSIGIKPATLRSADFRDLLTPHPTVKITELKKCKEKTVFTVKSDNYAHSVHFGLNDDARLSDEYFDLLPGEVREITLSSDSPMEIGEISPRYICVRP